MNYILCSIYDLVAKTSSDLQKFPNEASALRAVKEQMAKMPHPEDFQLVKNADVVVGNDGMLSIKGALSVVFNGSDLVKVDDESPQQN